MTFNQIVLIIYIAVLVLASLVSFFLFGKDKSMARNNGNEVRIKEKTLLASVVFGGAIGALIGRLVFHHKTEKSYFSLTIYFSILLEVVVLALLGVLAFGNLF